MVEDAIEMLKRFEGKRLKAYKCPAGVWTIGYGHTKGVTEGMTITDDEADRLLREDVKVFEAGVLRLVRVYLNPNQVSALTSFAYNVGIGAFGKSTLLKKVNAEAPVSEVRKEFGKWVYGGGKALPGLVTRRAAEADLYCREWHEVEYKCNMK